MRPFTDEELEQLKAEDNDVPLAGWGGRLVDELIIARTALGAFQRKEREATSHIIRLIQVIEAVPITQLDTDTIRHINAAKAFAEINLAEILEVSLRGFR